MRDEILIDSVIERQRSSNVYNSSIAEDVSWVNENSIKEETELAATDNDGQRGLIYYKDHSLAG
jgi:hypothetical protein